MGIIGDDEDERLKVECADFIRKNKFQQNKSYDAAMYTHFGKKVYPWKLSHWQGAMRLVYSTTKLTSNLERGKKYEVNKGRLMKKKLDQKQAAWCWEKLKDKLNDLPEE